MTTIKDAMFLMMEIFDKYAATDGNKDTLSKGEVAELLKKEFPDLAQEAKNKAEVDKMFEGLDLNGDSVVDFPEFIGIVAIMTCLIHDRCAKM